MISIIKDEEAKTITIGVNNMEWRTVSIGEWSNLIARPTIKQPPVWPNFCADTAPSEYCAPDRDCA